MRSTAMNKAALTAACAVAAGLGAYGLWPEGAPAAAPVQALPSPPPPPSPEPVEAPAPAAPIVSVEGLVLYGVSGGGAAGMAAVIGRASGYPRIVPVGRDYRPGLTVKEVGAAYAILVSGGQETRLELNGTATPVQPAAPRPAAGQSLNAVDLRLGLAPRKAGGFQVKAGADLPMLRQAGLRPGDVIVAVNGQAFDSEEKLMELPREIAGSYTAVFEFERGGKRMKATLPVNERPR